MRVRLDFCAHLQHRKYTVFAYSLFACVAVFVWALWASCVHCIFFVGVVVVRKRTQSSHACSAQPAPSHTHKKRERQKIGKINFFNQLRRNLQHNGQSSAQPPPPPKKNLVRTRAKENARPWGSQTMGDATEGGARDEMNTSRIGHSRIRILYIGRTGGILACRICAYAYILECQVTREPTGAQYKATQHQHTRTHTQKMQTPTTRQWRTECASFALR